MSIDWSKYGVDHSDSSKQNEQKTSVDFSKYITPQEPTFQQDQPQQQDPGAADSAFRQEQNNSSSSWNSLLDNPITHGVETGLSWVAKPFESVSTGIADTAGAAKNLFGSEKRTGFDGNEYVSTPSESRNLLTDLKNIWSQTHSDTSSDAWKSAFPNLGKMKGTDVNWTDVLDFGAQSVPLDVGPLLKGARMGLRGATEARAASEIGSVAAIDPLALPMGRGTGRINAAQQRSILPYGNEAIAPYGESPTMSLPEGNYIPPQRLRVESNPEAYINRAMERSKPIVTENMTPPLENPNELAKWVQGHMNDAGHDVSLNQVRELHYEDLRQLAEEMRSSMSVKDEAFKAARQQGFDLPNLLDGKVPNVADRVVQDAQKRAYGVYPEQLPNIKQPEGFNVSKIGQAAAPESRLAFRTNAAQSVKRPSLREAAQPIVSDAQPPLRQLGSLREPSATPLKATKQMDELGFAQTVKTSDNTAESLKQAMDQTPIVGARTTDVLNRQQAHELINKHGTEGLYGKLMTKTKQFSASENTAAQILAKHYSSLGGEDNLSKAIDLVSKTAKGGREMGQAIQALSQWNKLDETGALLLGERQLNRGVSDTSQWQKLTTAQGAPITEAAQRYGTAAETKSLADEVLSIVTNKAEGTALTDAEKATIKQFQDQVKEINSKTKPFLPKDKGAKVDATIKEVSQIEPKARTRDQVVNFLDAKAEKARKRLAAARNIGFAAVNKGNPIVDYSIIGASHIAKGIVKISDFTETMVRDFGESIKPHINEVFNKATNIFRKENGLPTVQELDRAVNGAIKNGTFTEKQAHQFKAWANEIGHMSDEFKVEATQDLQKAMNAIGESTLGQKIATARVAEMLLSLPTGERNVIGNEAFNILEKINKIQGVPLDWSLSKLTGERTMVFITGNQEKYWQNFVKGMKGGWNGVSPNGQFAALDIHPEAFKSKYNPLRYLQKMTGAYLQSFDHAAYRRAYGETLGTYSKLTGEDINKLDQSIQELADHAGQYATFQDETKLSKLAVGTKRLLNKPTDYLFSKAEEIGLPKNLSLRGFGAGDIVLAFAKTPANIIMRGIDYSPIGLLRGIGELVPLLAKKEFNQRQAVLALSRGITGTLGFTGLGYILASVGVLTGSASSDKDIQQLDRMSGKGEYKVNWSALERYIMGGLDKNAAQWKQGDHIFDWGWLQPMAISLAMGVNAQQSVAKQKQDGTQSFITTAFDALAGSGKTILQQPLLQGTQQLADGTISLIKNGSSAGLKSIAKGIPASFVPALVNQIRNFTDNTTRNTYDPSALKSTLNMIINKIPGLSKSLPVAYDTLGNAKEQIQGGQAGTLSQGLQSFASPIKSTTYTVSPQAKVVLDLINSTGNDKIAPRTPNSYIVVDKMKVPLTPNQYSEMQRSTGMLTQQMLTRITPMLENPKIKDDIKVKEIIGVLDHVGTQVRGMLEKNNPEYRSHALRR